MVEFVGGISRFGGFWECKPSRFGKELREPCWVVTRNVSTVSIVSSSLSDRATGELSRVAAAISMEGRTVAFTSLALTPSHSELVRSAAVASLEKLMV